MNTAASTRISLQRKRLALLSFAVILSFILTACGNAAQADSPATAASTPRNTDTPLPTPTVESCVVGQVCNPGEDWPHDCISSRWEVYPLADVPINSFGCYQQPVQRYFFTRDGKLAILGQHTAMITAEEYGLFTQIPQSSRVRMVVDLDLIENGELWIGIFETTNVKSEGVIMVGPPGDVDKHAFAIKSLPNEVTLDSTPIYSNVNGLYSLGFDVDNGSVTAVVNNTPQKPISFGASTRYLFIGYRAKLDSQNGTANISASVANLVITSK